MKSKISISIDKEKMKQIIKSLVDHIIQGTYDQDLRRKISGTELSVIKEIFSGAYEYHGILRQYLPAFGCFFNFNINPVDFSSLKGKKVSESTDFI